MNNKQSVLQRLQILKIESGLSDKAFKSLLAEITDKTPRTVRRWFSLDSNIQDSDLETIADHFGKHAHWLRYGERNEISNSVDQIMSSKHYGAIVTNNGQAEEVNPTFLEMMGLDYSVIEQQDICEYLVTTQHDGVRQHCDASTEETLQYGSHISHIVLTLGDGKEHLVETTSLKLDNGRILRILIDKGINGFDKNISQIAQNIPLNILYVDDDTMLTRLFENILASNNCTVKTFNNSTRALEEFSLNPHNYDLLISDIIMPNMNGDELAKQCLNIHPELPVILYTGYAQHQQKKSAQEFGVTYYLEKPIDSKELLSILDQVRESSY